jgi:hypothetical protein
MSDADPDGFARWFSALLGRFDASEVRLTAIEFGNEINNSQFNGDFTLDMTSHRVLGISDLNNPRDPEAQKLAAGLRVCPETSGWIAEFSEHEAD